MTIPIEQPARKGVPLAPINYTFLNPLTNTPIDLAPYDAVVMYAKALAAAQPPAVVNGSITNTSAGMVRVDSWTPATADVWIIQFCCRVGGVDALFGEPIVLTVAKNVTDLAANEQAKY